MIAAAPASSKQIGAIHALKARIGLDDDSYREVLQAETGQRSAKGLSVAQAGRVLDRLKAWTNPAAPAAAAPAKPAAEGALRLEGTYVGVCRALWLACYNLGLVRDRTDRALVAFVERQTGIASLNWVHDGKDARKVIEALKGWLGRSDITWDVPAATLTKWGYTLPRWRKLAVIRAQLKRLAELGEHAAPTRAALDAADERGLDEISSDLGRQLRKALGRKTGGK